METLLARAVVCTFLGIATILLLWVYMIKYGIGFQDVVFLLPIP